MMNIFSTRPRWRSKHGNALVMVMVLFLVMTIFSVALLSVAYTNGNLVMAQEKTDKAYYIARSVSEATADWISHNYYDYANWYKVVPFADRLTQANARITEGTLDGQDYTMKVWRTDSKTIMISASTTYQGYTADSTVQVDMNISANSIFDYAVYSIDLFEVDGTMNIIHGGGAGTNESKPAKNFKDFTYDPSTYQSEFDLNNSYNAIDINEYDASMVTLPATAAVFDAANTMTIAANTRFEDLNLVNKTLVIENYDTATSAARDVTIYVSGRIDGTGTMTIGGATGTTIRVTEPDPDIGGKVFIIVDTIFEASTNNNKFTIEGLPYREPLLYLFINSPSAIDTRGGTWNISAYVYMPFSSFKNSGGLYLNGAIISGHYQANGNNEVYFVPPRELLNTPFSSMIQDSRIISIEKTTWRP